MKFADVIKQKYGNILLQICIYSSSLNYSLSIIRLNLILVAAVHSIYDFSIFHFLTQIKNPFIGLRLVFSILYNRVGHSYLFIKVASWFKKVNK